LVVGINSPYERLPAVVITLTSVVSVVIGADHHVLVMLTARLCLPLAGRPGLIPSATARSAMWRARLQDGRIAKQPDEAKSE
jgi:hypothetical protein